MLHYITSTLLYPSRKAFLWLCRYSDFVHHIIHFIFSNPEKTKVFLSKWHKLGGSENDFILFYK